MLYPLRKPIDTAAMSVPPCGLIVTDCLSPLVRTSRRAAKPSPVTFATISELAGAAGNISRNTAGRLGPGTGKRAALGNDVTADFQPVAVACTAQSLLNRLAGCINRVGCLAANPFGTAICHGDGA